MTPPPTSPRQVQIDHHLHQPSHSRSIPISSPNMNPTVRPPALHRGSNRNVDSDTARERQMQQDLEIAVSMSRARSGSMAGPASPNVQRPSAMHFPSTAPIDEGTFPMLSEAEEAEMDRARFSGFRGERNGSSEDGEPGRYHEDEEERGEGMMDSGGGARMSGSSGFDSHARLLRRRGSDEEESGIRRELRRHEDRMSERMDPRGMGMMRSTFDFGAMEDFAEKQKGISGAANGGDGQWTPNGRMPQMTNGIAGDDVVQIGNGTYHTHLERTNTVSHYGDDHDTAFSPRESEIGGVNQAFHRRRQRKLSQSNPVGRRQAKLALFEGFGNAGAPADGDADSTPYKAPRQPKNLPGGPGGPGFTAYSDAAPGHDRPYRFSFYSNALPVTIHARTLAELPAEDQTFEDLFKGKNTGTEERMPVVEGTDYGSVITAPAHKGGADTPVARVPDSAPATGGKTRNAIGGGGGGQPNNADEDPEAFTWWLDVLSPTDEEMRMLSKVFGIHPLTTEDILLEETREKIELFRNYYLVCFRSFDQDPYSQTYLEPLNMYIIVFREGTLSFHFRGTPHPQNVRRRIKHLKDYISVTSDWISYALIDDITDAFGPLIQSIEYEVDSIDELVLILKEAEQSDMLRRIGTCRKKVMGLLRLMGNKADVVKGLAKRCNEQWLVAPKSDIGLYLSDIQDHLITMTQNLNHYEKILSRSHSNYLAQISIEMTDANNQINDVLSKLTALGTVLIPMNLVTGLWGMNVHVPGQDITTGYAWFGSILGCLAAFAVLGAWATYKCFVVR